MAEIPELNPTNHMEYTSPVAIASVEQAGVLGQDIQRTGNAITNLGVTIDEVNKRKEAAKRNLDGAEAAQLYEQEAIVRRQDFIAKGADTKALKEFNDSMDSFSQELKKNYSSSPPLAQQEIGTKILAVRNRFNMDMSAVAQTQSTNDILDQMNGVARRGGAITYSDPRWTTIDNQINTAHDTIDALAKNNVGIIGSKAALKAKQDVPKEIITGAYNRLLIENKYNEAKRLLEHYSDHFDQKGEITSLQQRITSAESAHDDHIARENARADRADEKRVKEDYLTNQSNIIKDAIAAGNDPVKQQKVIDANEKNLASRNYTVPEYNQVKSFINSKLGSDIEDGQAVLSIRREILNGNYSKARTMAIDQSGNIPGTKQMITPEHAGSLLEEINRMQKGDDKDPLYKEKIRRVHEDMEARFGKTDAANEKKSWAMQRVLQMTSAYDKWLKNMDDGTDPVLAWQRVIGGNTTNSGFVAPPKIIYTLPKDQQKDLNSTVKAFSDYRKKWINKPNKTKEDYDEMESTVKELQDTKQWYFDHPGVRQK